MNIFHRRLPGSGLGGRGRFLETAIPPIVVPQDGPDGWYRPETALQWQEILGVSPEYLLLCQDVSGSAVPSIDTLGVGEFSAPASGHQYGQTVTGWSSLCLGLDGLVDSQRWQTTSTALDLALDESFAGILFSAFATPAVSSRFWMLAGTDNYVDATTIGGVRGRFGGVTGASIGDHSGIDSMHMYGWSRRCDLDESIFCSDQGYDEVTHTSEAYASVTRTLGSNAGVAPPNTRFNLMAFFKGTSAEFDMYAMLARLRGYEGPQVRSVGTFVAGATGLSPVAGTHRVNDILFLLMETEDTATMSFVDQAGYSEVAGSPVVAGSGGVGTQLHLYWKRAASSAESNPVIDDTGNHQRARILAVKGCVTSGDPWDATPSTDTEGTGSTSVTIPGGTTSGNHRLILTIVTNPTDTIVSQVSGWANSSLKNKWERVNNNSSSGNGGGFALLSGELPIAGTYDATTATLETSAVQARMSIALKPEI